MDIMNYLDTLEIKGVHNKGLFENLVKTTSSISKMYNYNVSILIRIMFLSINDRIQHLIGFFPKK